MLSLIATVRNLQGITVQVQAEPVYFEGDNHFIRLVFKKDQPAFNLIIRNDWSQMQIDLSQNIETVRLPVGRLARGVHKIPQIKLQTGFPFGIARAWLWLTLPDPLLVAPRPSKRPMVQYPRQAINTGFGEDGPDRRADRIEEPGDLRDYLPGDAPSKIDWKRFAATRETMVREQHAERATTLLLQQDKGARDATLQFLCGGLQVAENSGLAALMTLDGADYFVADKTSRLRAYHASRVPDMLRASWVTQEAVITGLMLYLAAAPIALSLALLTHPLAFVLWTLMWLPGFMARRWPRLVLLLLLTPVLLVAIASLARPPAAPFFMLAVLIFSAADQVQEDGRPGAFNLVGVIFSALCVMVLSNGIFIFLMLLVSVILYTGIMTLRINRMPLSGLRIRLMPIVAALSGALFFAVVAFVLLPRVNPAVLPGLIDPTARTGVGDWLELGKFAEVIADDAEAFRAFLPEALPPDELYWRVYLLSRMQGAQWQRETLPTNRLGPRGFSKSLTPEKAADPARALVRYGVRAVEVVPKEQPVLGAPIAVDSPDISLNVWGEVRPSVGQSNLPREIRLLSHLGNPFAADLTNSIEVSGQPRLQAWARQLRAEVASPSAFAERLLQHFAEAGYRYSPQPAAA